MGFNIHILSVRNRSTNLPSHAALAASFNLPDSKASTNEAVTLSERALALDPQNVRALTVLAGASLDRVSDQWSDDPPGDIAHAEKAIDAALALQPENSLAHYVRGYLYQVKQQWGPSIAEEETAIALDPNNARAHGLGGLVKMFVGRSEDGLASVETALRLSPRDPHVPWWQFDMCALLGNLGHDEQAIPWCNKAVAGLPQVYLPLLHLAGADALAGHDKDAKEAAAQLLKVYPGFTVQGWASIHWSDDPTFNARYQRVTEGLRKAGLPEGEKKPN
jgi:adenylate cyclase